MDIIWKLGSLILHIVPSPTKTILVKRNLTIFRARPPRTTSTIVSSQKIARFRRKNFCGYFWAPKLWKWGGYMTTKTRFYVKSDDSKLAKRVLMEWENRGNCVNCMNNISIIPRETIYFWKGENLFFSEMNSFPGVLWRHLSCCHHDFPYFPYFSQYISTLLACP